MVIAVIITVLVTGVFLGGVLCMCHAGEKEGICKYENERKEGKQ